MITNCPFFIFHITWKALIWDQIFRINILINILEYVHHIEFHTLTDWLIEKNFWNNKFSEPCKSLKKFLFSEKSLFSLSQDESSLFNALSTSIWISVLDSISFEYKLKLLMDACKLFGWTFYVLINLISFNFFVSKLIFLILKYSFFYCLIAIQWDQEFKYFDIVFSFILLN